MNIHIHSRVFSTGRRLASRPPAGRRRGRRSTSIIKFNGVCLNLYVHISAVLILLARSCIFIFMAPMAVASGCPVGSSWAWAGGCPGGYHRQLRSPWHPPRPILHLHWGLRLRPAFIASIIEYIRAPGLNARGRRRHGGALPAAVSAVCGGRLAGCRRPRLSPRRPQPAVGLARSAPVE